MLAPNGNLADLIDPTVEDELLCFDPWIIAYSRPRAQKAAKESFERIGYECWYPVRKIVTTRPQRTISSKTRHKRKLETVEKFEPVLGAYLLVRPIKETPRNCELYELPGIGGFCHFGDYVATVADFQVEMLRLAEADGRFNVYHATVPKLYRVTADIDPRRGFEASEARRQAKEYDGTPRDLGHGVDRYGESVHFVEKLGRVIRLIQTAQPPQRPNRVPR